MLRGLAKQLIHIFHFSKFIILLLFVIMIPRISFFYLHNAEQPQQIVKSDFKLGLENFVGEKLNSNFAQKIVGLITNQTGKDQRGLRNVDLLKAKGMNIAKIFAVSSGSCDHCSELMGRDIGTGATIINLYAGGKNPLSAQNLQDLDLLVFDVQDIGMRQHGYIKTLLSAMHAASDAGKTVIVLDRPNLLGACMEGACGEPSGVESSDLLVPLRHGMTVGELATYFNMHVLQKPIDLRVVQMDNYNRCDQPNFPWTWRLSTNITSADSCYGYSFLGLLGEVAPFEIGVGTNKAFQCVMLPDGLNFPRKKWAELQVALDKMGIESAFFTQFIERKKKKFSGLRLTVKDINTFSSFNTLLTMLSFFKKSGLNLSFSSNFDKAAGSSKIRDFIQDKIAKSELERSINVDLERFYAKAAGSFLYYPLPRKIKV